MGLKNAFCLVALLGSFATEAQIRPTRIPLSVVQWREAHPDVSFIHLYLKGDPEQISQKVQDGGGTIKAVEQNVISAFVSFELLDQLDTMLCVDAIMIDLSSGRPMLDASRSSTKVAQVHAGIGALAGSLTGNDVIVGIIDAGLDLSHHDFRDTNGNTRVIELWDQTMAYNAQRTPVYGYGQVWDSADINDGICPHNDQSSWFGHGTNTAGIAVSNGNEVNNFIGMAPDADIIIVSVDFNAAGFTSIVADAVDYIFERASAIGKPCVINASVGTYAGSHDARDMAAQIIEQKITAAPGRAMVCAAGNSRADTPYHLGYDSTSDTSFTWLRTASGATAGNGSIFFEVFGDTGDFERMQFSVGADRVSPTYKFAGSVEFDSVLNRLYTVFTDTLISVNGNYLGVVQTWADSLNGTYRLQVFISEIDSIQYNYRWMVTGSGRQDVWSGPNTGTSSLLSASLPSSTTFAPMAFYILPDDDQTIVSSWACSDKVITVANEVNRISYANVDGGTTVMAGLVAGQLAASSSAGPARTGLIKPDIAAPGDITLTAGAQFQLNALLANASLRNRVAVGAKHHRAGGTSSASPVIAGIGALFFEYCPMATWEDFREAVHEAGIENAVTGQTPNNLWGYGKTDALQVLRHHRPHALLSYTDNEFCEDTTLTISLTGSHSSIVWSTGDTSQQITVSTTGSYFAQVTNDIGCRGNTDTVAAFKRPLPAKPTVLIEGQIPSCANESVRLSIPNGFGAYVWSNGLFTNSILVTESGEYACEVSNIYNCKNYSDTVEVLFYEDYGHPELHHQAGDTLRVFHDSLLPVVSYRWYQNGVEMSGDTASVTVATEVGIFRAEVIDSNACVWPTNNVTIYVLSADERKEPMERIFPNPTGGLLFVPHAYVGQHWTVEDATGQTVKQGSINGEINAIDMSVFAPGFM